MTDVDLLMLEYNHESPIAILEFKSEKAEKQSINHPTISAIRQLSDRAGVMFFGVRYERSFKAFRIFALNDAASEHLQMHGMTGEEKFAELNEEDYVDFLFGMCGTRMPPATRQKLFGQKNLFDEDVAR